MTKFLNESGFRRIVKTIKNALAGKQDKKLVVTVTGIEGDNITADKTYNEILAAYNSGADVLVDDGYGYFYHLIAFDSGWFVFMMKPHDEANSDYYLLVSSQNVWTSRTWEAQEKLTSGTNIKTINNTSLLGNGNISIEPNEITSITTTESTASGGNNTVTINTTNGTSKTFNVKNGKDGKDGQDGQDGADGVSLGEIALVQTTGDSEESVMSQKAVTDELSVANYTFNKPNYFRGVLCHYNLADFPKLDPRTCDGISIVFDGKMLTMSERSSFLEIIDSTTYNTRTGTYFAIAQDYSYIKAGLLTNYYQSIVNGTTCQISSPKNILAHMVITFNFVTGEVKVYNNGALASNSVPDNYDEQSVRDYLGSANTLTIGHYRSVSTESMTGMAIFPYVMEDDEVDAIYGIGAQSTKGELIPQIFQANLLYPQRFSGANICIYLYNNNIARTNEGDAAVITSTSTDARFGFTGIDGTINNHIYEWDMEVVSGTWTQYSRGMVYNNSYYKVVDIYDSNGNNVSYDTLNVGNYHVVCKPDNILARGINAERNKLNYIFTTTEGAVMKVTNLKVVEKGAALVCDVNNFKGDYFLQVNGDKVPKDTEGFYNNSACIPYYDTYKADIIAYASSKKPEFTGQMAVDIANNKVYVGYLTGIGTGTWKQINNS